MPRATSARAIRRFAAGAGVVYAGTDAGVFARADADASWRSVNAGPMRRTMRSWRSIPATPRRS